MPNSRVLEWFELPTADLARAIGFYNAVLSINLQGVDLVPAGSPFSPAKRAIRPAA
jgi:predicted enzyme related to lactoylglutathione lyase